MNRTYFIILVSTISLVIGCGPTPATQTGSGSCLDQCDNTFIACGAVDHNNCAHCCEPQPYVDETKDGTLFTRPIEACSSTALPPTNQWNVSWCLDDCNTMSDEQNCVPAHDSCVAACPK